ncbi:MAG: MJ0042-type zinc finger domain-containing protein [Pirellulales bacterium]
MSQGLQIACPHCGMQYAITNPQLIGQTVPCSQCRQMFLAQPLQPPGFGGMSGGFGGMPEGGNPFAVAPAAMPGMAMPQSLAAGPMQSPFGGTPPRRRKGNNKGLLIGGLAGGGVLALLVVLLIGWKMLSGPAVADSNGPIPAASPENVATNAGNTTGVGQPLSPASPAETPSAAAPPAAVEGVKPSGFNPIADTPAKVADDVVATVREVNSTLKSIRDPASRDAAIKKLAAFDEQFTEQLVRVSRFAPLPNDDLKQLLKRTNEQLSPLNAESKQISSQLQNTGLVNEELLFVLIPLSSASSRVLDAIDTGLRELPAAKLDGEKYELELAQHLRAALVLVSQINSADDYGKTVQGLQERVEAIADLVERLRNCTPQEAAAMRASLLGGGKFASAANSQLDRVALYKLRQFGAHEALTRVLGKFSEKQSDFQLAKGQAGLGTRVAANGPGNQPGAAPGFPPGAAPGFPPGAPPGFPPGPRPGFPGGGPAGQPPTIDEFRNRFIMLHGADNVVTVMFAHDDNDEHVKMVRQLRGIVGSVATANVTINGETRVMFKFRDVQALADKIDFAKVVSVDKDARTIELETE